MKILQKIISIIINSRIIQILIIINIYFFYILFYSKNNVLEYISLKKELNQKKIELIKIEEKLEELKDLQ